MIEDDLDNRICGMAMCLFCREESGNAEISELCFLHNPDAKNKKKPRTNDNVICQVINLTSTSTMSDSNDISISSTTPTLSSTTPSPSYLSTTISNVSNLSNNSSYNTPSLSQLSSVSSISSTSASSTNFTYTSSTLQPSLSQYSSSILTYTNEEKKQRNKSYRKYKYRCCYKGCNNNDTTPPISLSRIPPPQKSDIPNLDSSCLSKKIYILKKSTIIARL